MARSMLYHTHQEATMMQRPSIHLMCLAVVWAMAHFRPYLYGQKFTLVTDHQPLKWLVESNKLTGKLARWALLLQEYDFEVVHKAGAKNLDVDGLSLQSKSLARGLDWSQVARHLRPRGRARWHASTYLA